MHLEKQARASQALLAKADEITHGAVAPLTPIAELWAAFGELLYVDDRELSSEVRNAFYMGAIAMWSILSTAATRPEPTDFMRRIHSEISKFMKGDLEEWWAKEDDLSDFVDWHMEQRERNERHQQN